MATAEERPVTETDVGALVASGEALVRIENETQMTVAIQRPRNEAAILKAALEELRLYKSCAEQAIYSKPVGRLAKCPECGAETRYKPACPACGAHVPVSYARGLSIRAAENLSNRWANSAWAVQQVAEDDQSVTVVAIFMDYEKNIRHAVPKRISRLNSAGGDSAKSARRAERGIPATRRKVDTRNQPRGKGAHVGDVRWQGGHSGDA